MDALTIPVWLFLGLMLGLVGAVILIWRLVPEARVAFDILGRLAKLEGIILGSGSGVSGLEHEVGAWRRWRHDVVSPSLMVLGAEIREIEERLKIEPLAERYPWEGKGSGEEG